MPEPVGAPVRFPADGEVDDPAYSGGHDLVVVGHGRLAKPKHRSFVAPEAVVAAADIASLADAIRNPDRCCFQLPEMVCIALAEPTTFNEEMYEADPVHLEIDDNSVFAVCGALLFGQRLAIAEYELALAAAAKAHDCRIASVRLLDQYGDDDEAQEQRFKEYGQFLPADELRTLRDAHRSAPRYAEVRVEAKTGSTVRTLLSAGRDVHALLQALRGGVLEATSTANLLRAGRPQLVVGLPESHWFEAKSTAYPIDPRNGQASEGAKIELAQDVARFANGDCAALLVIGLRTARQSGIDVVVAPSPVKLGTIQPQQYRDVIDARVYPSISGLTIEQIDLGNGKGLLLIEIPVQPAEYRPFLVHGAIVGSRVEGAFISIVKRRGEGSIPVTASQIHAALAAGVALLRGPSSMGSDANEPVETEPTADPVRGSSSSGNGPVAQADGRGSPTGPPPRDRPR
jgi:hypothetical protein